MGKAVVTSEDVRKAIQQLQVTMTLTVGYNKRRKPETMQFRNPVDVAEMIAHCDSHGHVWFHANDGTARIVKINGKVRTWKRDANRIEIPYKYGMYEYGIWTASDIERVLIEVK